MQRQWVPLISKARTARAGLAALATAGTFGLSASSAQAGVAVAVVLTTPQNVTVGQSVPGSLSITNASQSGPGETGYETDSVRLDDITLVPSCGPSTMFMLDCPVGSRDPGALTVQGAGSGRAGTACAGQFFSTSLFDPAQGKYRLTPTSTVVLGPASGTLAQRRCIVDFTYVVNRSPNVDSAPGTPGAQTDQKAFATATDITQGERSGVTGSGVDISQTTVARAAPSIATQASPTMIELGQGTLTDTATVTGLVNPVTGAGAGTVTFTLFGPDDAMCTTPILTRSVRPLTLNGAATVGTANSDAGFAPSSAGTYRWIASYSGDANNAPVTGPCNDVNEQTDVTRARPTMATQASPTFEFGEGTLTDTATVSGLVNPVTGAGGGTVTFKLFGPNDAACTAVVVTRSGRPLTLNGAATAGTANSGEAITPTSAGTYRWIASYTGDANNAPVTALCDDVNEQTVVQPSLSIEPSGTVTAGQAISSVARLAGGAALTGNLTFRLYGPGDESCSATPATTVVKGVAGDGDYGSGDFAAIAPGNYRWVASYGGDANHAAVTTACGEANVAVTAPDAARPTPTPTPPSPTPTPTVISPVAPTGLTLKARPTRDRRLPYSYRFTGKLGLPAGITAAQGCVGEVTVRVKNGRKTISARTVQLTPSCTYASKVMFTQRQRLRRQGGKLRVLARFLGNTRLTKVSATTRSVRYR